MLPKECLESQRQLTEDELIGQEPAKPTECRRQTNQLTGIPLQTKQGYGGEMHKSLPTEHECVCHLYVGTLDGEDGR